MGQAGRAAARHPGLAEGNYRYLHYLDDYPHYVQVETRSEHYNIVRHPASPPGAQGRPSQHPRARRPNQQPYQHFRGAAKADTAQIMSQVFN